MPRMASWIGCFVLALATGALPARATVLVPGDASSIPDGLALAELTGDTHVLVLPGDYFLAQAAEVPYGVTLEGSGAQHTRVFGPAGDASIRLTEDNTVANLTIEGGLDGILWDTNTISSFWVHDVWFVDQSGAPLLMPSYGYVELFFERNVLVRPSFPVDIKVEGDSGVWLRNNHFVGSNHSYVELTFDSNGGFGSLEIVNNIFENGGMALSLFAYTDDPFPAMLANNTFNNNDTGLFVRCTGNMPMIPEIQNNWFHDNGTGADFSSCPLDSLPGATLDYNGWGGNTTDLAGPLHGPHALFDVPTYQGVTANDQHLDDDYDLAAGAVGNNEGEPSAGFYDADDGTRNDIGSYGGPSNTNWNWDGDPSRMGSDCDDRDPARFPYATELCDGIDNDCDNVVPYDERDSDADGVAECDGDCDDANPFAFPGNPEQCDEVDNDCDGFLPPQETSDNDGDGYVTCMDCEDQMASVHPGAVEICDGWDTDCDGSMPSDEEDNDGDGAFPCDGDCDDTRPDLHHWDEDNDGVSSCDGDCNDHDDNIYPFNDEDCGDHIDNDCDDLIDEDDPDCGTADDDDVADDDDDVADEADDDDDDIPGGFHCVCSAAGEGPGFGGMGIALALALIGLRRHR